MFRDFLHSMRRGLGAARKPGHRVRRNPSTLRLQLESLENRLTPSTLTVTSSADSGGGSLRAAIAGAASGDTIVFAKAVHAIPLTTGELAVNKNLDIEGPGADKLTISGSNSSRVFHISGAVNVTIAGLTVTHGQSTGTLPQMGIYAGTGSGGGGGGGILNEAGATLSLVGDNFTSNTAVGAVGFTVLGGALLNLGTAHVQTCSFTNNQATGGGALDAIGGSGGGAISNFGGPTGPASLTLADSTFSGNQAFAAGGGFYFGLGGALDNDAGLNGFDPTLAQPSSATVTNCSFLNNVATGGPNVIGNGGAITNVGPMTLVGCTISGNRSVGGGGGDGITTGDSEGVGGGIINLEATLTVDHCAITNNLARGGDNAVISSADATAGGGYGGGIENNAGGVLRISNSLISGNTAQGGATAAGPGANAIGGGISNSAAFSGSSMQMTSCTVTNNSAIGGQGGPGLNTSLAPGQQAGFGFGGGIDISHTDSTATITGSTITGNKAVGGAGGAGNQGNDGLGGGIGVGWGDLVGQAPDASQLTLSYTLVANNQALGGSAAAGGGTALGGGLSIEADSSATVNFSPFNNNLANGSQHSSGQANGGGGINNAGTLALTNSTLVGNQAVTTNGSDSQGGALLNNEGKATIQKTTFSGNAALGGGSTSLFSGSAGGAIDNYEGATLNVAGCSFAGNEVYSATGGYHYAVGGAIENDAGAVNNNTSTVIVSNSTFTNNLATGAATVVGQGGAIGNESLVPGLAVVNLTNCRIVGNRCQGGGGGNGVTTGDSEADGGALQQYQGTMNVEGCTIAGNQAIGGNNGIISDANPFTGAGFGGAIENNFAGVLKISNSILVGNIAQGGSTASGPGGSAVGGAITNSPNASMTMTNCVVSNNSALAGQGGPGINSLLVKAQAGFAFGGGIDTSNSGSTSTIIGSTIAFNRAVGGTGANGNAGGNAYGGGLSVGFGTLTGAASDGSSLTLLDSYVSGNVALGGAGGAGANGGNGEGGALYVGATASAAVNGSQIDFNAALAGLAGLGGGNGKGIGGGVYNDGTFTKDLLTVLALNLASTSNNNIFP